MQLLLSEAQKRRIKAEFYKNWKTCENEMIQRADINTITASRQPMIFALREVLKTTGVLEEIDGKYDGRINGILEELQLKCCTCGKRLNAYAEVGKYLGDDEFWHSFTNVREERKIPVPNHAKTPRPRNTRIYNSKKSPVSTVNNLPKFNKPSILCIDDSLQILQLMEKIVTKQGYQFIGIQDPLQVLPTAISQNPDLIFSDIEMPVFNGYEICHQIRNVSKLRNTPIVMLTSNNKPLNRLKAKMAGASDFLTKPIEISQIVSSIEKYLPVEKNVMRYPEQNRLNPQTKMTGIAI